MLRYLTLLLFTVIFPTVSNAASSFDDNFDDGDMAGWSFDGINTGPWSAVSGEMQSASTQTVHVPADQGGPGTALISGVVTPDRFSLEADIRVIGDVPVFGNDWGHVGFVWGWSDSTNYNASYLRTHRDEVTSFGTPGGAENLLDFPGAVNDVVYHMKVEVDFKAQVMSLTIGEQSATFTGVDFQEININSGGSIGLITWGERVGYDNVVFKDLSAIFSDGFEGLSEGSVCTENVQCASGLLCCYPCGISGCENQCTVPVEESCPMFP